MPSQMLSILENSIVDIFLDKNHRKGLVGLMSV